MALVELREDGLYCPPGDIYIDPWSPVPRAVITHAHSDHARPGAGAYLTAIPGEVLLRERIGPEPHIQAVPYGERLAIGDVAISLHPAGHILGSAQIRIEHKGEVCVVSGDYKLAPDPTCAPFETVRCHTFVTESTFGLPVFRWPAESEAVEGIHAWWRANQGAGKTSLLFAYPLGKAQRVLAALDPSIGPIYSHGAVERISREYRRQGITVGGTLLPATPDRPGNLSRALIVAPPWCHNTPWAKRLGPASTALVSGWMRIRGARRRRALDRGFVLSDHADWPALLRAIDESRAESVHVTHGYRTPLVRWLQEHGRDARELNARYEGEREDAGAEECAS